MEYKEGDNVVIKGNDGKIKNGVIRVIIPDVKTLMAPELDWDGEAYIVDCNEKANDGIRFCHTIPFSNIMSKS